MQFGIFINMLIFKVISGLTFSNLAASVETLQGGGEAIQSPSVLNLVLFRGGKRKRGIEKQEGNRRNLIFNLTE